MAAEVTKPSVCDMRFARARDYSDDVGWGCEGKNEGEVRESLRR
jgi:hypothetical protein